MSEPPDTAPEVSVLIPVRNGASVLTQQLEALHGQSYDGKWEIVVVDNGSTDGTADLLAAWTERMPWMRVVHSSGPPNASRSRNLAAHNARGSLLAFCDADDVVDSGWLDALVGAARSADLVAGRLDVEAVNDELSREWRSFAMPAAGGEPAFGYLPYAVSANMAVRRSAFRTVEGFDPAIPGPGSEEIDFCWRLQQAGFRFAYESAAVVAYRFRVGLRAFVRQQFRYGQGEAALYSRHGAHMTAPSLRDLLRVAWYAVSRSQHVLRGQARRGRYLGYIAYRTGRLVGAIRFHVTYW